MVSKQHIQTPQTTLKTNAQRTFVNLTTLVTIIILVMIVKVNVLDRLKFTSKLL